jgi:Mce-associated membrane protein
MTAPETGDAALDAQAAGDSPDPATRPRSNRLVLPLLVASVVLAAFAVVAGLHAHELKADRGQPNLALTDRALTHQVSSQVSTAVSTIFSYRYTDPGATSAAAQRLLTGTAIRQYNQLFKLVAEKAPAERLVLRTQVTQLGVELLTPGRARLLVFVNQQDQAGSGKAVYSGAMFAVTAVLARGHWLISTIDTFTTS